MTVLVYLFFFTCNFIFLFSGFPLNLLPVYIQNAEHSKKGLIFKKKEIFVFELTTRVDLTFLSYSFHI